MGLLDNALKNAVNHTVNKTVNQAVNQAVDRTVNQVVDRTVDQVVGGAVNKAADAIIKPISDGAAQQYQNTQYAQGYASGQPQYQNPQSAQANASAQQLGGLFAGFASGMQSVVNEAAKNMKICPACGTPANAEIKFCADCGAKLPSETVGQGAVCSSCGKQNVIGTKFCADCGAKLPGAIAEEQAARAKSDATLAQWDALLPQYPKWAFGGVDLTLEQTGDYDGYPYYNFSVSGVGRHVVEQYRQMLRQSGFRPAGQYPDESQLFKRVDGLVYNCDTEHAFDVSEYISLGFTVREPSGGFDYVKPEAKPKPKGFLGLLR